LRMLCTGTGTGLSFPNTGTVPIVL
jgi:hypothetical protein